MEDNKQNLNEKQFENQEVEETQEAEEKQEAQDTLFKKLFYTGIGLTASTKEKMEKKMNELVTKKKITAEEGKKIVDDFVKDFDTKKDQLEKDMKNFVKKTAETLKFAKKRDLDALNDRLDEIESKMEKTSES